MSRESTLKPFARGDVLVGCTLLNNAEDDHAGDGRIIQYDADLNEKGVLWLEDTTHLVLGLRFAADKSLWAFDSQAWKVMRLDATGARLPVPDLPKRSFSNVNFLPDGDFLLGEHLVGNKVNLPPGRNLGTRLPKLPGTDVYGDGHVFRFHADGTPVREYATETHGGMGGFLGVTTSSLAADGRTLVYTSETGPRVFRYDIEADRQLPDLVTLPRGELALLATHRHDGSLLFIKAKMPGPPGAPPAGPPAFFLQHLDADGQVLREYSLPGGGWATILPSPLDHEIVYLGNFFTGTLAKMELREGTILAQSETGVQRSLAGLAQYPG